MRKISSFFFIFLLIFIFQSRPKTVIATSFGLQTSSNPDMVVKTTSNRSSKILRPIWNVVNTHALGTYFNNKSKDKKTANWLKRIFPFFNYARVSFGTGGSNYCIMQTRTGETFKPLIKGFDANNEPIYDFSQRDKWLKNLLDSGVYPEILIDGVPRNKYFLGKGNVAKMYDNNVDGGSIAAPLAEDEYSSIYHQRYIKYIDTIYQHDIAKFGRATVSHFKYVFWHEPEGAYNPYPECAGIRDGNTFKRCKNESRFNDYYKLYKRYYDFSMQKYGRVYAAPVFMGNLGDVRSYYNLPGDSWLERFLKRASSDNLKLPSIGIDLYYHVRNNRGERIEYFTRTLEELKRLLSRYNYNNIPLNINETGILKDSTEYGASGLAYIFKKLYDAGTTEIGTWLTNYFFSYNYWKLNYQDPSIWIKTASANVLSMLNKMKNTQVIPINETPLRVSSKSPYGKIDFLVTKDNNGRIYIWGFHFIGGADIPSIQKNPDVITNGQPHDDVLVKFDLSSLSLNREGYKVKEYLVDHTHSNFFEKFRQDHPTLHLPYFPRKGDYYHDHCTGASCCLNCPSCGPAHNQGEPLFSLSQDQIRKYQANDDLQVVANQTIGLNELNHGFSINIPAWSIVLLELDPSSRQNPSSPLDSSSPSPVRKITSLYNEESKKVSFYWNWAGDSTCTGCEPAVGYCSYKNSKSSNPNNSINCSLKDDAPFWWHVVRSQFTYNGNNPQYVNSILFKHYNDDRNLTENATGKATLDINGATYTLSQGADNLTASFSLPTDICKNNPHDHYRIDVQTRDARGNMTGEVKGKWPDNRSAEISCCSKNNQGNADCNSTIDNNDYKIWQCEYINNKVCRDTTVVGSRPSKRWSDFNLDHNVDLVDFEIWREGKNR